MSSRKFKGSLKFTHIQIFLLTTFCASYAVDVVWEADFPAVFGNVTYLQCTISDAAFNCSKRTRQWIGGPKYRSLCYEDKCAISNKYEVMKQPNCLYTLMIRNFSEQDVNCEYTCSYGVSRMRRNLTLDEKRFIYEPHVKDIQEESRENGKTLNLKINISKIFPTPSCGANLKGKNITDHLQNSVTKPGFYFAADLQINLPMPLCGNLNVYCYLGEHKINITSKNFDNCHLQGGKNSNNENTGKLVWILLSVILVIIIICVIVCRRRIRKRFC